MWNIDDFEIFNPIEVGQRKSRLQHLADINAFTNEHLCEAANVLENINEPTVAVFFQIPDIINAESGLYAIGAREHGVTISLRFSPILLDVDVYGRSNVVNCTDCDDASAASNATQVIAYVPLWGKRATYYHRYERCFTGKGMRNDIVIYAPYSWVDGRTLRAKDFERNLTHRIVCEVEFCTRRFLRSYSSASRRDYTGTSILYNLFIMPFPGRVSYSDIPVPLISYFVDCMKKQYKGNVDRSLIESGMDFTYRGFSRVEKHLFELSNLAITGHYALAFIGCMSLIEWMLRVSADGKLKKQPLEILVNTLLCGERNSDIRSAIHEMRKIRNSVVHLGEFADAGGVKLHEITHIDIDSAIKRDAVELSIEMAWRIFRMVNTGRLKESGTVVEAR